MSDKKHFFSSTAEMTCLIRAKSFYEKRVLFKGDDFIAVMICNVLDSFLSQLSKSYQLDDSAFQYSIPAGSYEYILARTNYVDDIFEHLSKECQQVFILGAGFDSRCCRFQLQLKDCRVFECDHPNMQKKKVDVFNEINIEFPPNVQFLPVDFSQDNLATIFKKYNVVKNLNCLFIIEGLTYYLQSKEVENIFAAIDEYCGPGSQLFFDFLDAGVLRGRDSGYGLKDCLEKVDMLGEAWTFGIDPSQVGHFIKRFNFDITETVKSEEMSTLFFSDKSHLRQAQAMGSISMIRAKRNE